MYRIPSGKITQWQLLRDIGSFVSNQLTCHFTSSRDIWPLVKTLTKIDYLETQPGKSEHITSASLPKEEPPPRLESTSSSPCSSLFLLLKACVCYLHQLELVSQISRWMQILQEFETCFGQFSLELFPFPSLTAPKTGSLPTETRENMENSRDGFIPKPKAFYWKGNFGFGFACLGVIRVLNTQIKLLYRRCFILSPCSQHSPPWSSSIIAWVPMMTWYLATYKGKPPLRTTESFPMRSVDSRLKFDMSRGRGGNFRDSWTRPLSWDFCHEEYAIQLYTYLQKASSISDM